MSTKNESFVTRVLASLSATLFGPVGMGLLAALVFYALIRVKVLDGNFYYRYFDSHWCLQIEVTLFFVAAAALVCKALGIFGQWSLCGRTLLEPIPAGGQKTSQCDDLLTQLDARSQGISDHPLVRRLREGLLHIKRKHTADELDEHLRYLADLDSIRCADSYGLVKIVLWAIPILGFLGTVIGITMAIAALNPSDLENSIKLMTDSLNIAFDTTALALSLCIPLMFGMFYVKRQELRLMDAVDARADAELLGRFERLGTSTDPHAASVERMAQEVVAATEMLVKKQAEIWQRTVGSAHEHWTRLATTTSKQTEDTLAAALERSLKSFAGQLAAAERGASEQTRRQWTEAQQALIAAAGATAAQQKELTRQTEVLVEVVGATGQVEKLEAELNRNLSALAGAKLFEETLGSLAAAIHLLSARLGQTGHLPPAQVHLAAGRTTGKAA
ncbi:MAG: MotA/TolQ/ExbB proton channel family protein [Pirellulales bacterium]